MGAGSVVAAVGRGLCGRLGRKHNCAHTTQCVLGVGGVRAFFYYHGSYLAMQRNRARDGKLQLDGDVDGEQWVDQRERTSDSAKLGCHSDGDRD